MRIHPWSRFWKAISLTVLSTALTLLIALTAPARTSSRQQDRLPRAEIGLEIRLANELRPLTRFAGPRGGVGSTVIPRRLLRIKDPQASGDLTGLQVQTEVEGDGIRVSLSVIYNDLSNHEWWKDKKEKVVATYLMRASESIRTAELDQFGIEPLELKAIDASPVVLKPEEGPRITNSAALEVEKVERHFDSYRVWLKNKSDKNIVVYSISTGRGVQTASEDYRGSGPVLRAGATSRELRLYDIESGVNGIALMLVVFEDGTFEGDPKLAVQYLAKAEGVRIQSPSVLRMIEQTLKVDDSDVRAAFDKLEAELWVIPEALYKAPALEFLKAKFPDQDEKSLSGLYEVFKGGLYDARNIALASLGETGRTVKGLEERGQFASAVESIRSTLQSLRETFGKITSAPR